MKREEIQNHPGWKYISGLSAAERYLALTGRNAALAADAWHVRIEEWAFTRLSEIPPDWAYISATDHFRNIAMIMVMVPLVKETAGT